MSFYYRQLEQKFEKIAHLENILGILNWDIACNIKSGSEESRSQEIVSLSKILHQLLTSNEIKKLITLSQQEEHQLDAWQKANLREIILKVKDEEIVPEELQKNLILSTTKAEIIWRQARKNNDYELFKPYLAKVIEYKQQLAKIRSQAFGLSLYDSLLDQFSRGMTTVKIKKIFDFLKTQLPVLIKKIVTKKIFSKNDHNNRIKMNIAKQKDLNNQIMSIIGFDFNYGRLDESTHPFCGGTPFDIRLTTRYDENNLFDSFFATVHEVGHALYEQNLPLKYKNQPVGKALDLQFYESQSLLMEKQVAKSKEFLVFLANYLQQKLNLNDATLKADNLYLQANKVQPSFIRVDADEVTYCLHIILRFEIEELLINGQLSVDELPNVWNQKMKDYLGIVPSSFSEGCLQDVHWPSGSFGYFPSYANGMIISAMVMKKYSDLYPDYKNDFLKGDFTKLNHYLNQNFRNFGSFYNSKDLLLQATGESEINPHTFLTYLENKYLN
ncbi:carboxypeptidase M32 [Candidatus Phytoplasma solani]|uniref:Metal-dependent carboxypeptidase n=1 Tax=Candidatus Phytoplasma solani TaxID=69896 RepID=A0A421NY17_9MOLU|nr:carboxypeptidase M32 [Candidatus Phytoplasma solani]RMI88913.1 carboxypeptidase Taq [Candidatus Phytoplasma solani]